jgi:hypothetical protein
MLSNQLLHKAVKLPNGETHYGWPSRLETPNQLTQEYKKDI